MDSKRWTFSKLIPFKLTINVFTSLWKLDSIVCKVTRLQAEPARYISPPKHPDWLWDAPSFHFNSYWEGISAGIQHVEFSDDTFTIWPHGYQTKRFLDHPNNINKSQTGRYLRLSSH